MSGRFSPPTTSSNTPSATRRFSAIGTKTRPYLLAVSVTTFFLTALLLYVPWAGERLICILLLPPVILSAYFGGLGPGLLSTFLSAVAAVYFVVPPLLSFRIEHAADAGQVLALLVCGGLISGLLEASRRGRRRDRKQIEHLTQLERRLRDSIRESDEFRVALDEHAIVAITDAAGKISFVNDRFCNISGYSREELLGRDHRIVNSGHHPKEFFRDLWQVIRSGKVWHGEVKNRAKNGAFYWVDTTIVPFLGPDGVVHHYIAIRADITARKLADEEIQRQRSELQILFDLNPAMIGFKDTNNNILRVNQRAADALGLPVSAIEGRPVSEVYPAEAASFHADDLEVIRSGSPKLGIVRKIHGQAGEERWLETNKVPYRDSTGKIVGLVVTAQDITERQKTETALRLSEERFLQLAENVNEVFWIEDPADGRVLYISPAYETIWGRSCASLYANPDDCLNAIHVEDRERVKYAFGRAFEETYDQTYRIIRPDGQQRWIHDRGFPVRDANGKIYRLVGTAEDITETRRLHEQLLQAQKMEAIGTLAGGIAHDFNNILGGIVGYTELARLRSKDNPTVCEHLDAVLQASRRAADLVQQILTFSRRHEHRTDIIQLRHLVSEAIKLLRASIPATIDFDLNLEADVAPVRADPTQIHQIVLNLCANAEYAMRGRPGRLSITLKNVRLNECFCADHPRLQPGPHVRLTVSDTGDGIPPAIAARIFEPFFTTKPPGQGSGLGLSVVHGVMNTHGGIAVVHGRPGEGALFELYFPAAITPVSSAPPSPRSTPKGRGEHILFIDDEPPLAQVGRSILETLGYRATACTRPEEALAILAGQPEAFDLVITDHTMPGMTGLVLANQIRTLCPGLPVILVTGYCADAIPEQTASPPVRELLFKPIKLQTLGEAVRRHLQASKSTPAS
jgi:PAS domain S-box-containing protein